MALVTCPTCASDEDIHVDEKLGDGRLQVRCGECGTGWVHEQPAVPTPKAMSSFDTAWLKFPTPALVSSGRHARVEELKQQFLAMKPVEDFAVAPYWRHYQQVLSREGLWTCKPQDLKDFANSDVGANPATCPSSTQPGTRWVRRPPPSRCGLRSTTCSTAPTASCWKTVSPN